MFAVWLGAFLIVAGVAWAAITTIQRGRLSDPEPGTLEPRGRGRRLSLVADLPAFVVILIGVILIFAGPLL